MATGASQSGVTFSRGRRGLQTLSYIQVKGYKKVGVQKSSEEKKLV
jgi:hypothetical protein